MKVYKCDRCKDVYDSPLTTSNKYNAFIIQIGEEEYSLDLCPACQEYIDDIVSRWMEVAKDAEVRFE